MAKRDIKVLNYQLSQLVSGANDKSNTLTARYPIDIEVMEETLMTYRVHIKNQYCPIKILIHYNDNSRKNPKQRAATSVVKGDLKVFCSMTNREPNEHDCFRSYVNVSPHSLSLNMFL